jgi:uncharacterized membrane protein
MEPMRLIKLLFVTLLFLFIPATVNAQGAAIPQTQDTYLRGSVDKVLSEGKEDIAGYTNFTQKLRVRLESGAETGKAVDVDYGGVFNVSPHQRLNAGDNIIVIRSEEQNKAVNYYVMDRYRLPKALYILAGFFILAILVAGKKGLGSIIGLIISIAVILMFIVPQILAGRDPLLISITGALVIMIMTIFLAHGVSKKTTIALVATFLTLITTGTLGIFFVFLTNLTGLSSEESYLLQFGQNRVNMQGLLLGGLIIGALGVLDDITTAQSTAIFELSRANSSLSVAELIKRGMVIGREHVASLVNTLVLAYAGSSMTLFILFILNPSNQPYWVILNSEIIIEELVRTMAGSIGLILAIPITTVMASWFAWRATARPHEKTVRHQRSFRKK